jgi:hypothetical protein
MIQEEFVSFRGITSQYQKSLEGYRIISNLYAFNIAILSKQVCKFMHHPQSRVARLFNALYFGMVLCWMPLIKARLRPRQSRLQVEYRLKIIDPCLWISLALGWSYFTGKLECSSTSATDSE